MFSHYAKHWFPLQGPTPFASSMLWDLQRRYFVEQGREAWRNSEVPHYVTSNPTMANCYAELAFACLRDQGEIKQPLTICELGAGSGRFAFHFLRRLSRLCELADVPLDSFRYIMSDYADSNLDAWHKHPSFQHYFASGVLDMAHFDVNETSTLELRLSGDSITPGSLQRPLLVLANYLFDSVPQDLYHIKNGEISECLVALDVDEAPSALDTISLLQSLRCSYSYRPVAAGEPQEPALQNLLEGYRHSLEDSHLLFPANGLRCLTRLKALSTTGLILLSADKGDHHLQSLENAPPPEPERHGSFSLQVNFHAMTRWCEQEGGLALKPVATAMHVGVCGLLMVPEPESWRGVRMAFRRYAQDFNPDDFYTISLHARNTLPYLSLPELLAHFRLAHYDSHLFGICLPRLMELSAEFTVADRDAMAFVVQQVWKNYYPLGEDLDLADHIGYLMYMTGVFELALLFYERSCAAYGTRPGTLYNRALCQTALGRDAEARALAESLLLQEPENQWALDFLREIDVTAPALPNDK